MIHDKREFEVELVITSRHLITTYSRTPEEAERDAEDLYADGHVGTVLSYEVEQVEAYPVDDEEMEAEDDDLGDE